MSLYFYSPGFSLKRLHRGQVTRNGQEIIPSRILRVLRLLLSLALILGAVGGSKASSSDSSTMKTGISLRKVVSILFAVLYVVIALIHGLFWSRVDNIFVHRRTVRFRIWNTASRLIEPKHLAFGRNFECPSVPRHSSPLRHPVVLLP